jgi:hypothetical protein
MFCSFPFKPLFLCDLSDSGILFVDSQSSVQRMFLLERANQFTPPCWAGSRASHQSLPKLSLKAFSTPSSRRSYNAVTTLLIATAGEEA